MISWRFKNKKNQIAKMFQANPINTQKSPKTSLYLLLILGLSLLIHILCMTSSVLLVEEAYYWNYAQHLDFSYLDHPPMVALLIKLSTLTFGTNELGVRMTALICWMLTAFFSYKLADLIQRGTGLYAVMLLAVLPFFFVQSLVITPDLPLIVCWAASLYCLYRALILNQSNYWYVAGIWLGAGMLSKYTISLLGLATLFYVISTPTARLWFKRKEPYIGALIAALIFSPVIYWNATHEWASFIFQSGRRFTSTSPIRLHHVLGLSFIFLTPIGISGLWDLIKKNSPALSYISTDTKKFINIFTWIPWGVFALFSLNHHIKLNWIGPTSLAIIPWFAILIANIPQKHITWLKTATVLLCVYSAALLMMYANKSELIQQKLFKEHIAWHTLTEKFHSLAKQIAIDTQLTPAFVPLDNYQIGSELAFYQAKYLAKGTINQTYPTIGAHIFGGNSLMYRYWSTKEDSFGKPLILIATNTEAFDDPGIKNQIIEQSKLNKIQSISQGQGIASTTYYYKIVQMKQ